MLLVLGCLGKLVRVSLSKETRVGYEPADEEAGSLQKVPRGLHANHPQVKGFLRDEGSNRWKVWKALAISRPRAPRYECMARSRSIG
jgi:hypothetical protein